ncbi:VOC family protein [Leucobacter manosquensis]|uniref:VOC family protein n=1 Tax=Leucobacter manosquensis TaxID=2810611 RepID=A0ABS5M2U5_9MICO|nr:VOC family protein [Leucobacter manosquensis]MBS3181286.1 VOC family protein [Leucobacter manosquensis]
MTLNFDFIGIVTADLGRSLDFYRSLGVPIPEGLDDAPHVEVQLPGGMKLAWDPVATIESFSPGFELPEGENRIAFACSAASPAEVDFAYAEIVERHPAAADTEPWDAPWGQRYATVRDPDGNSVDIYAPLPTAPADGSATA